MGIVVRSTMPYMTSVAPEKGNRTMIGKMQREAEVSYGHGRDIWGGEERKNI